MKAKTLIAATLLFFAFVRAGSLYAQSFSPDVIGSAGNFTTSQSGSMAWTIGEVMIETYSSNNNFFTQGFHQPNRNFFVVIKDFFIPEGFSPNEDGINDMFAIRGIQNYPNNTIVIFNRWGNKLFEASPYQNNWSGKATTGLRVGGDELSEGVYFYVLDLGNNSKVYKGTIYLNR